MRLIIFSAALILLASCKKDKQTEAPASSSDSLYFPPVGSDAWETRSATALGWDTQKLQEAIDYAGSVKTYGLIILYKGRIVTEQYWNGWNRDTKYPINSAGKSVTALLTGIAKTEGLLNLSDPTSRFLGTGWTSMPLAKENLVTIRHQLTMTTGLDDGVPDDNCLTPSCLVYKFDAGTRWAYHNAPYRLLQDVLAQASGTTFNQYTRTRLSERIGMKNWTWFNYVLYLNTRDMARFGLLTQAKGKWNGQAVLNDSAYFHAMTHTSQDMNKAYGYLWWLNGSSSFMIPTLQTVFAGPMAPDAPADMLMALGKDDKKIYVVPSLDLVVVRHGDDAGTSTAGPSAFDNVFWGKLKLAIKKW
jgi:CubicO group peptidase (beta-lactamase class C family)